MYKFIIITVLIIFRMMALPVSFNINDYEKHQTGYIKPDIVYPSQPVKLAELEDVTAVQLSGKQAYPLEKVCEALGYAISWNVEVITITKDEELYSISTNDTIDLIIIDSTTYATDSLFCTLFGISFRYLEDIGLLEIFK